ncbi:MAG: sensor histidine kinase, partial [Mycobacteriales bacterium]
GDVRQRVPVPERDSEVSRLARALNRAFDERAASEDRLRRFLADASHELRTPLTTIRAWADLYREGGVDDPETLATAMNRIDDEAQRMSRLVAELLRLARVDVAPAERRSDVDLTGLVTAAVEDARIVAPARAIELHRDPVALPPVSGDPDQLHGMVRNLVANAVRHTPAASPVDVGLGHRPDPAVGPRGVVVLTVADRGPGIPEAIRDRLFEPFVHADIPGAASADTTGLGLAIVRSVATAHGGSVTWADRPGGGTLFTVVLPARPRGGKAAAPGAFGRL